MVFELFFSEGKSQGSLQLLEFSNLGVHIALTALAQPSWETDVNMACLLAFLFTSTNSSLEHIHFWLIYFATNHCRQIIAYATHHYTYHTRWWWSWYYLEPLDALGLLFVSALALIPSNISRLECLKHFRICTVYCDIERSSADCIVLVERMISMQAIDKVYVISRSEVPQANRSPKVEVIRVQRFDDFSEDVLHRVRGAQGCVWAINPKLPTDDTELGYVLYTRRTKEMSSYRTCIDVMASATSG